MKSALKILIVFALSSAFIPLQGMYEYAAKDTIQHSCCNDSQADEENQNTCKPLCQCISPLTLPHSALMSLSFEVKFIYYLSNTNKFPDEKTKPVFRPPIT